MTKHRQVRLTASDGRVADVDELMASLISALWKSGYTTQGSCQEEDGTTAWIAFASKHEAEAFRSIAGNGAVHLEINLDDFGPDDEALGYTADTGAIAFPAKRIDDVTRRVQAAGAKSIVRGRGPSPAAAVADLITRAEALD